MNPSTPTPLSLTPDKSFPTSLPRCCPCLPPRTYPLTLCPAKTPRHSTLTGTCSRAQNTILGAGMYGSRDATAASRHLREPVFLHEGVSEGG